MKIEPGDYGIFKLYDDGRLEAFGLRVVFFRIETRASIRATILDLLGKEGGSVVLRLVGERIGKNSGEFAKKNFGSALSKELFDYISNIYLQSGRGKREFTIKDNEVIVKVYNSFEADAHLISLGRADEPSCFFIQGYLKGLFSIFTGKEVDVEEVMCKAKGDPYCEFHVKFRFLIDSSSSRDAR